MHMFNKNTLDAAHATLFDRGMAVMDAQYSPPFLWDTAKLSTWYAVGLLARDQPGDREKASKLIHNVLTQQYDDVTFPQNLHSFKDKMEQPLASGADPLWVSEIYDSYDPNNALFVTMGGIMIDALYSDKLPKDLMNSLRQAMHRAVRGNIPRTQGWHGDDMCASYSNPFFMRCICAAYVGNMMQDQELVELSDSWTKEATALWEEYDSPGEFNSPTYAGITLMALGLAQYCPGSSLITQVAPKLLYSTWKSLGETYNPSLKNVAPPWDRAYGYCMTRYYACIGAPLAALIQDEQSNPIPYSLDGCPHYTDVAMIPMQMIISQYVESFLTPEIKSRFIKLDPHTYNAISDFPRYDKVPREYSFHLSEGLSIGGVSHDETRLGGPKGDITQFVPGGIQWDSGKHGGGVGWIAVWPTAICAKIVAKETSLTISLPKSMDGSPNTATKIELHISCLPSFQMDRKSFNGATAQLPGLAVELKGNIADRAKRVLKFDKTTQLHGARYYQLVFDFEGQFGGDEVPELEIGVTRTEPPVIPFAW